MRPFKDKGWPFCSKFQEMLPEPGAKGHSVFVPTLAMAPPTKDNNNGDDMVLPVAHMGPVIIDNSANNNLTNLGLNTPLIGSVCAVSAGKGKHSTMAHDNSPLQMSIATAPVLSRPPSPPPVASGPSIKKKQSTVSSVSLSTVASKPPAKITPTIAIYGMQGTMNQMTDVLQAAFKSPSNTPSPLAQAINLNSDNGLIDNEKSAMVLMFVTTPATAVAYLSLTNEVLQRTWAMTVLQSTAA
jgi:hypothetical protein